MDTVTFSSISRQGRRSSNQDACLAFQLDEDSWFFAVADGMGGTKGGEIASQLTIETANGILSKSFGPPTELTDLKAILNGIVTTAHETILKKKAENPELEGMGTTLTCLLIHKSTAVCANIGDSRIYRLRNNELEALTTDHTYVQDYIQKHGEVPAAVAKQYGHYLTRVIDGHDQEADLYPAKAASEQVKEGDVFLLCSDGLITDKVNTNTNLLKNYILGTGNLEEAGNALYEHAYFSGSDDNITVVLVEIGTLERQKINLVRYDPEGKVIKNNPDADHHGSWFRRFFGFFFQKRQYQTE